MPKAPVKEADVILAASESDMDLYYATRFAAPDPFPFFRVRGRKYVVASDLEIGRARAEADVHTVLPLTRYRKRLRKAERRTDLTQVLIEALRERKVNRARVPAGFPVAAADRMRRAGISVKPVDGPYWPDRVRKRAEEVEAIREAARRTGEAIEAGIDLIRRSKPLRGRLRLDGADLTSERVRTAIDVALLERGMAGRNTIVAGGEQAVDPHDRGSGPLRSGWPVIIDCFPRSTATGYHADITRTVHRGRPSKRLREMWDAVREAQALGCELTRPGAVGKEIHAAVKRVFEDRGFETGPVDGKMQGFFHGTGHGLGLDVHEAPFFSREDRPLEAGMVITIEPGLYYPGVGGIRIEDDVLVTKDGHENLVATPKQFAV